MASTFSTDLALELVATGEKAGLWGTITNTNLQILQQSTTGVVDVAMTSDQMLLYFYQMVQHQMVKIFILN
jgi:hypothetical protein